MSTYQERRTTDPVAILSDAHDALETFRGYLAGIGDESIRDAMRERMFEPLSRAVGLLHMWEHIYDHGTEDQPLPAEEDAS